MDSNISQIKQGSRTKFLKGTIAVGNVRIGEYRHDILKEWFLVSQKRNETINTLNEG